MTEPIGLEDAFETHLEPLAILEDAGFEAWFVGGCVRDALRGAKPDDFDITTDALWQDAKAAFEARGFKVYETGTKHGTITACKADASACYEVTTYRVDGGYADGRHPDQVTFASSLADDLARRDFTMNAVAYNPRSGLFDPFQGAADIERQMIRTVGDPTRRFQEDALRILRGCRFVSTLGFELEGDTYDAMVRNKSRLRMVSMERISAELNKLLLGPHPRQALMQTVDVLSFVLPELVAMRGFSQQTKYHVFDVLEHTAVAVQNMPASPLGRWAALCHDMGKPASAFFDEDGVEHFYNHAFVSAQLAHGLLKRIGMSDRFATDVCALVRMHDYPIEATSKSVRRALGKLDGRLDLMELYLDLCRADSLAHAPKYQDYADIAQAAKAVLAEVVAKDEAFSIGHLAIGGEDVIALGVKQGPKIGRILKIALEEVVERGLPNERDALLRFCESIANDI